MIKINGYSLIAPDGSDAVSAIAAGLGVNDFKELQELSPGQKKQLRRTGAFHSSAVRAVVGAGADGLSEERLANAEIILVSSFGDQDTTGSFIDDLIDYGMDQGSPIKFAHSNHNTAAAYVAKTLNIGGAVATLVNFENTFINGLKLAMAHLEQGTERDVILIHVESCSELVNILANGLKGIEQEIRPLSADEKICCKAGCLLLSNVDDELNVGSISYDGNSEDSRDTGDLMWGITKVITSLLTDGAEACCMEDGTWMKIEKIKQGI